MVWATARQDIIYRRIRLYRKTGKELSMKLRRIRNWVLYPESPVKLAIILTLPLTIVLCILFFTVIYWENKSLDDIQRKNMLVYSRSLFQHIVTSPIWRMPHNGYFVEVTQHLGRNEPGLSIMGKDYVRIDPALMGPRLATFLQKRATYRFHLTSLESQQSSNRPDEWELGALRRFKNSEITEDLIRAAIMGNSYYRYMAPVPIEGRCLRCHINLTAGMSIDIPVDYPDRLYASRVKSSAITFATFGLFVLAFVMAVTFFFSKRISDGFKAVNGLNEKLRALSARDERIIESIVDGMAIISPHGTIDMVNSTLAGLMDREVEEIINMDIRGISDKGALRIFTASPGEELELDGHIYTITDISIEDEERGRRFGKLRILHDATREKLSASMELAGAAAHEMRQPLSIILTLSPLIKDKIKKGVVPAEELSMLESQCERINEIITRMLNITHYRTKAYAEGKKIFDLRED
ncbi:sensory histidine kinase AtoS [bacterium BMS3Bbin06]|nr:sensory histidine kinase AtoS [bacterium BMS3Abin08]GBE34497.1 sensory histidine kinase AtoS [bacterium BMS3Bbin06]HDY70598.1 DUF3365 domain-containing protein [Nitrospirota bacterium]